VIESAHASERVEAALAFLTQEVQHTRRVVVVARTKVAALDLIRKVTRAQGHVAQVEAHTLRSLAGLLSRMALARARTVPAGTLTMEAVLARGIARKKDVLGRFSPIHEEPGLSRALARTLVELRLEGVTPSTVNDPSLAKLLLVFEKELADAGLCDPASVLASASANASSLNGAALLLLDAPCMHRVEADFVTALSANAAATLITMPSGDTRARQLLGHLAPPEVRTKASPAEVERVQANLFSEAHAGLTEDAGIGFFSAPGESREGAEIARRILALAAEGVPFDEMGVLLRSPSEYGMALEEAFARAKIPAYFARGTRRPDPSGRALLALLACADEGLSATRFSEYLSLGELPRAEASGAPPPAWPSQDTRVIADDEIMSPQAQAGSAETEEAPEEHDPEATDSREDEAAPVVAGSIRAPKLWERMLVDAAVIGGLPRWEARLKGYRAELVSRMREEGDEEARVEQLTRELRSLDVLRAFALPLLAELGELSKRPRPLSNYAKALSDLATRALRRPERVLAVLAELYPMGKGADVTLSEVRLALTPRLVDLTVMPGSSRYGKVYVAPVDEARGMTFQHVFVPGLVERGFPKKLSEDPMFLDRMRGAVESAHLVNNEARADQERLALRLALGAATTRATFSYSRVDTELGRPKTPSFYALELVRAQTGKLAGFEELAERADSAARARIGWPAPESPRDAIDESEHDLALLSSLLYKPEEEAVGTARYLLSVNPYLARALRFRAKRWLRGFSDADGMVDPAPEAKEALMKHATSKRSFSPTALQNFAACPYRFYLYSVHKLSAREEPHAIEEMDALQKGSFVHEVLYEFLTELRAQGLLPMTPDTLDAARERLDHVLSRVERKFADELCPAIDRVWEDGVAQIRADVREWLRREVEEPQSFQPTYFELSFGLAGQREASDAHSQKEWASLECGINLRGSIDLVEQQPDGTLRATDYKTGKKRAKEGTVIGGGKILQPVLYALTLEKIFPGTKVSGGRLYYASSTGGFESVPVRLDEAAREGAKAVGAAVTEAIDTGFLPALPDTRECEYCDYKPVCGPYEGIRTRKKKSPRMEKLVQLRRLP
jgi:CRISPR/Cas system-associated exonuclease Cas4 (RecB family)